MAASTQNMSPEMERPPIVPQITFQEDIYENEHFSTFQPPWVSYFFIIFAYREGKEVFKHVWF